MKQVDKYIEDRYYSDDEGRNIMFYDDVLEAIEIAEDEVKKDTIHEVISYLKEQGVFSRKFIKSLEVAILKKYEL